MVNAFKPLSVPDLLALSARENVDAGLRTMITGWTPDQLKEHADGLHEMRTGDPMMCPICDCCFVQVLSVDRHEVLDKAYTIELMTIPPDGECAPIRGKRLGSGKDWIHEHAKIVH